MEKRLVKDSIILLLMTAYILLYKFVVVKHLLGYSNFITASMMAIILLNKTPV